MITCVVDYVIDSKQIEAFEKFAKRWIDWSTATVAGITDIFSRQKARATVPWRSSAFQALRIMRGTEVISESIRNSSMPIAFATRVVVCFGTSGLSCGHCSSATNL